MNTPNEKILNTPNNFSTVGIPGSLDDAMFENIPKFEAMSKPQSSTNDMSWSDDFQQFILESLGDEVNVTFLLSMQIYNRIVSPLNLGDYAAAQKNFCEYFGVEKKTFDDFCMASNVEKVMAMAPRP